MASIACVCALLLAMVAMASGAAAPRPRKDVDECSQNLCEHTCFNYPGGYRCFCYSGYSLAADRRTCKALGTGCEHPCQFQCRKMAMGGYWCVCPRGLELSHKGRCKDINECMAPERCPSNRRCVNMFGSYMCLCPLGFEYKEESEECVKIKTPTTEYPIEPTTEAPTTAEDEMTTAAPTTEDPIEPTTESPTTEELELTTLPPTESTTEVPTKKFDHDC